MLRDNALFLQGAKCLGANLDLDLLAIDGECLGLKIWLPDLLGMALAKANVIAVLLAFAGYLTFLHSCSFIQEVIVSVFAL